MDEEAGRLRGLGGGSPLDSEEAEPGVTIRALAVGAVAVAVMSIVAVHSALTPMGSLNSHDYFLDAALFLLMVVLVLNKLAGLAWRRLKLSRGELGAVFLMLLAAAPVASIGFITRLVPALGGLTYYASPENRWGTLLHPHVPPWTVPGDAREVTWLFEGVPRGQTIPWASWAGPVAFWSLFFFVVTGLGISLAVLFRRQWMERERLAYPIMALPIGLLDGDRKPGEPPLWRRKMLWLGCLVAFAFASWLPISRYSAHYLGFHIEVPRFDWFWREADHTVFLRFRISFAIIGLTYLVPQEVSLSCWLFAMLYQLQRGLFRHIGFDIAAYSEIGVAGGPFYAGQAVGIFLFVGAAAFWLGRRHLCEMFRVAFSFRPTRRRGRPGNANPHSSGNPSATLERPEAPGATQPMPPTSQVEDDPRFCRAACFSTIGFAFLLAVFVCALGTPAWLSALIVLIAVFCMVAITKIVMQCGLGWVDLPMPVPTMATSLVGTRIMSAQAAASVGLNYTWTTPMRLTVMGTVAHGLKLAEEVRTRRQRMIAAFALAVAVALASGFWFHLKMAYEDGGANVTPWFYQGYAQRPWIYAAEKVDTPHPPRWRFLGYAGMGATAAAVMQVCRHRLTWWPFSVVGLAGAHLPATRAYWFSIFLVWLIKGQIIRYGGQRAYRTGKPFFLGILMGHTLAKGIWYVLALFTEIPGAVFW